MSGKYKILHTTAATTVLSNCLIESWFLDDLANTKNDLI